MHILHWYSSFFAPFFCQSISNLQEPQIKAGVDGIEDGYAGYGTVAGGVELLVHPKHEFSNEENRGGGGRKEGAADGKNAAFKSVSRSHEMLST